MFNYEDRDIDNKYNILCPSIPHQIKTVLKGIFYSKYYVKLYWEWDIPLISNLYPPKVSLLVGIDICHTSLFLNQEKMCNCWHNNMTLFTHSHASSHRGGKSPSEGCRRDHHERGK